MKWRWIEKGGLVRYVGRMNSKYCGMVGTALKLMGRKPMNILVDFNGEKVICPIGTLRMVRDK